MLNVCDFIQVYVFTTNHHLKHGYFIVYLSKAVLLLWVNDDVVCCICFSLVIEHILRIRFLSFIPYTVLILLIL